MRYKGILLDIDGTLYDYEAAHAAALEAALGAFSAVFSVGPERAGELYREARKTVNARLAGTAASHSRLLYFQLMFETAGLNALKHSLEYSELYWRAFLAAAELRDGAADFLAAAAGGAGICLLTDLTAEVQHRKVLKLGLGEYARWMVTSEEAGAEKPAAAMFRAGLAKLGTAARETCMIGDDWKKDIEGGTAAGLDSYWLSPGAAGMPAANPLARRFGGFRELAARIL